MGLPGSLRAQSRAGLPPSRAGRWTDETRPSSDGFPRHLPDKVSSTSSSSGLGPGRGRGCSALSPFAFVLRDNRSHVPSRAGLGKHPRPAPPHPPRRSLLLQPARRLSLGPGAPERGHQRDWAWLGEGGGALRVRGSLPGPAVPAANRTWSDRRRRSGKSRESAVLETGNPEVISTREISRLLPPSLTWYREVPPQSSDPNWRPPNSRINTLPQVTYLIQRKGSYSLER